MPRVQLTFTLPDEAYDAFCASNAGRIAAVVCDMDRQLRAWLKYGHQFTTADEALEAVRGHLQSLVRMESVERIFEEG